MSLEQEAALDECVAWANYEAKETPINRKWLNAEDEEWAKNDFINEIESSLKEPTRPTGESRICKWDFNSGKIIGYESRNEVLDKAIPFYPWHSTRRCCWLCCKSYWWRSGRMTLMAGLWLYWSTMRQRRSLSHCGLVENYMISQNNIYRILFGVFAICFIFPNVFNIFSSDSESRDLQHEINNKVEVIKWRSLLISCLNGLEFPLAL